MEMALPQIHDIHSQFYQKYHVFHQQRLRLEVCDFAMHY